MKVLVSVCILIFISFSTGLEFSHGKDPTFLLLVSPDKNHATEYGVTRQVLESSRFLVKVACDKPSATDLNGRMIPVDVLLKEVRSTDYDAIVIIGGYSVWKYIGNPDVNRLLQSFYESGKIVGAICAGTYVLGKAGLLKDRQVTGPKSEKLVKYGAQYIGSLVQQDGKIITARGPSASEKFGKTLVEASKLHNEPLY